MSWWVKIDWSTDHQIILQRSRPNESWNGPFDTFTQARAFVVKSGVLYAKTIMGRTAYWRTASKYELMGYEG